jgi:hypothetical protein
MSCKKENLTNMVENITINGNIVPLVSNTEIISTTVPYNNNLVVVATLQKMQSTQWVKFTVDDITGQRTTPTTIRNEQKINYSNGMVQATMPGGMTFMQPGRTYLIHIVFTNTDRRNLLQIDATVSR